MHAMRDAPAVGLRRPAFAVNILLSTLVLAGGVWAYTMVRASDGTASTSTARRAVVAVATVTATVSTSGTVASSNVVAANFTTGGIVTKIYVKLGQAVTKGQKLARVDATGAKQQLRTAEDNLAAAEDSLTRAKAGGATLAIDSAQLQVDAAKDGVTSARAAVDGTVLIAPITGTVIAQSGMVGASASSTGSSAGSGGSGASNSPSGGFIQIADLTKMEVDTNFPEADATKLKAGMPATITWNALVGANATGTVVSIDPTATTSNNVVTYGVVIALTSLPGGFRIGQSTTVVVTIASKPGVLAVPNAAVTTAGGVSIVQRLSNGVPTRTPIQIGLVGDTLTEITSGLAAGDQVLLPTVSTTGTATSPFAGGTR